ncbi:DNA polymerase III subunit alpha [bacterium]|nr:DNA polymerase III subunit alpha [bacterium]
MAASAECVHLHVHSHYSLLDGAVKIPELVKTAAGFGMPAVALTDHGNMFGAVEFFTEATEAGLKPILGYEAYVAPKSRFTRESGRGAKDAAFHLTLLAENETGYHNLARLATIGYLEGFYYKPRIDMEVLEKYGEGIVVLSGCLTSELAYHLKNGRADEARAVADRFRQLFPGRYYLEIQENGIDEQRVVNEGEMVIARDLGLPVVATSDIHYLRREDARAHDVLLCINTGKLVTDTDRMKMPTEEFFFASPQQMAERFRHVPEALANTLAIAERCNVTLDFSTRHFPPFDSGGMTNDQHLRKLAYEGLHEMCGPEPEQRMLDRLEEELAIIQETAYASYFLIVRDFFSYAREQAIPVGVRGSGAGCLITRVLGMIDFNPVEHGLLFKRFLAAERREPPDIDVDLCELRREEVLDYVRRKYGAESVAQIITFGTLGARAAVRDVGRVLDVALRDVDAIAKAIPEVLHISIEQALEDNPDLRKRYDQDSQVRELLDIAMRLEGLCRHASTHAAGVVVGDRPLVEHLPLCKTGDNVTTQFVHGDVEKIGLLKMDFLGLRSLTICSKVCDLIEEETGERLELTEVPLDDAETYALLHRGEAEGVFQLASQGMRNLLTRLKPDNIEEIIALVALYRPGPLKSGMVDKYIRCKHGQEKVTYIHPSLEPHLKATHGVIVYQEQIMQIAHDIGGLLLGDAYTMIKAISKKKEETIRASREAFIHGAKTKGLDEDSAVAIFDLIEYFAGYGFNKAHSTAYAYLTYRMAYLRAHYPVQFFAASMTCEQSNRDQVAAFIKDAKRLGIEILRPSVNTSYGDFRAQGGNIRYGMAAMKGVGSKAVDALVEARKQAGPFQSIFDFAERVDTKACNRSTIEALIKCGAFDELEGTRGQLLAALDSALQIAASTQKDRARGQKALFDFADSASEVDQQALPAVDDAPTAEKQEWERDLLGFYISGHPLDEYADLIGMYVTATTANLAERQDGEDVTVAAILENVRIAITRKGPSAGKRWARYDFSDLEGSGSGVAFAEEFAKYGAHLKKHAMVFIRGRVDFQGNEPSIRAQQIIPIEHAHMTLAGSLVVDIDQQAADTDTLTRLRDLCASNHGELPVHVRIHAGDEGVYCLRVGRAMYVEPSEKLIRAAAVLVGQGHVRFARRETNGNGQGRPRRARRRTAVREGA